MFWLKIRLHVKISVHLVQLNLYNYEIILELQTRE